MSNTIYRVKPKFNGKMIKDFENPAEAIDYFYDLNVDNCGKMYGSIEDKLNELKWIGKLEIIV